jgi:uncharacterized protein (DUF302 family)
MIEYGFVKEAPGAFDDVCSRLRAQLENEGFGVLVTIDMAAKLKEKLGVEMGRYVIFGVCNPPLAYRAVTHEENIGLMLPCNAVVYEKDGRTVLGVIKPTSVMSMIDNRELQAVAEQVEAKLERVFDAV